MRKDEKMNRDKGKLLSIIVMILGMIPTIWLGLKIAPAIAGGLPEVVRSLLKIFEQPFRIVICEDSVKTVLLLLLCYGMGMLMHLTSDKNYRSSFKETPSSFNLRIH